MLRIKNVTKYYGDFLAVDNLNLEVKNGEIFGLLGVNGAGKTTTFRMICNLLEKSSGEITFDDKVMDYGFADYIGFLPEERSLLNKLTVLEQAYLYGGLKSMSETEINNRLDYLLNRLEIPEYKNRKIKELSKGNQQKIQFIMSILHSPKLLILDEPFSGLDPLNVELFKNLILELKNSGTCIIFSSHRMDHVEYFCESLVILSKGKTLLQGKLSDIKASYGKRTIRINADVDKKELENIKGVIKVSNDKDDLIVKVENTDVSKGVFKVLSKCKKVNKFIIEEPTLNEIFIEKVGKKYE